MTTDFLLSKSNSPILKNRKREAVPERTLTSLAANNNDAVPPEKKEAICMKKALIIEVR